MKTWILKGGLGLVITATLVVRSTGQPAPANAPATTNSGPRIQFESLNYDWGSVRQGTKVTHDYVFTNTGDAELQITGVHPGCHCTTVGEWTHQVEPGKTGVIPIRFDSTGFGGVIYRSTSVTCNDKTQPTIGLQLHGTVTKPIDVSSSFVFLNIAPDANQETNGVVHIVNNEAQPLLLSKPTSSQPTFTAELKTNIPGKSYDVILKTVPPLAPGNNQAAITITSPSTGVQPIYISAIASVQSLLTVMPTEIILPAGPLKANERFSVSLQNRGAHPLVLSDLSVNAPGATTTLAISKPGQTFTASVEFATGFVAPAGTALELSIKTDNPRQPLLKIPIRQIVAGPSGPPSVRIN